MESREVTIAQLRALAACSNNPVINPVRILPEAVTQTATQLLEQKPPTDAIQYVNGAFYYYRAAVFRRPLIPVTEVNGGYEWLEPADFGWNDVDQVTKKGQWVIDSANIRPGVLVNAYYDKAIQELVGIGTPKAQRILRWYKPGEKEVAFLEETARFRVTPGKVGFLRNQIEWQLRCLEAFASSLIRLQELKSRGDVSDNALKILAAVILRRVSEPYAEKVLNLP